MFTAIATEELWMKRFVIDARLRIETNEIKLYNITGLFRTAY
jgi:hypothetical protein